MLELRHLTVLSLARAHQCGIAAHARASYVCALHREGAPPIHISFESFERILEFVAEMNPRTASVEGGRGEDVTALVDALDEALIQFIPTPTSVSLH